MNTISAKLLVLVSLSACGSTTAGASGSVVDGSALSADTEDDDFMGCPDDIPAFGPGLRTQAEHIAAKLVSATPTDPTRNVSNRWTVELSALDGSPAAGATITHGQTFMPIHGHDGRVDPQMTALAQPGQFDVDRLSFTMRGPWEVRLWVSSAVVADELVVFHVCVAQ